MKKYKKLNLRKLSVAKLEKSMTILGGTGDAPRREEGTRTRTLCGDPCAGHISIDNTPCRQL